MMEELAKEHGLSSDEYQRILDELGREPSLCELGVLSVMWSEHCSYKSSRVHLKKLPTSGPQVVQGPGENAGAVDIGGGLAAIFKMESHNHPSFIEPYQGAATGVGGILRDVFTMGARPIGNLNSLRFGNINHPKTKHLFHGVVGGIAGYGNCVGVPTVGGEVYFDDCYNGNILVNVFTVGVAKIDRIFKGSATGPGNPVFYVGAGTGRDGIHGATMASEQFDEGSEDKRPTVQVGDPFREKLLIEACLELMETGAIIGIQDMGAAGLTSSSVEMADRGGTGLRLVIEDVPMREEGMNAYEVLLSESQERMLVVIAQGREDEVGRVFSKWELEWAKIGEVTDTGRFEVVHHGKVECDLPVSVLTSSAPVYDRPQSEPARIREAQPAKLEPTTDLFGDLVRLLGAPNICSRRVIYEQFDHMVGLGTVLGPGSADAAVLRIPGTNRAIAAAVDVNSRFVYLNPYEGTKLAVAEVTRNVACTGAKPLGTTDCLNFGDPTNPEIMWEFAEAIRGMAEACLALDAPIVGGNVSLYNASAGKDIFPTPTLGCVGAFESESFITCGSRVRTVDDLVAMVGVTLPGEFGGSEYQRLKGKFEGKPPKIDLDREARLQAFIIEAISLGYVNSAHDCSEGGLLVCLAEKALGSKLGLEVALPDGELTDVAFGESASRIALSFDPDSLADIKGLAQRHQIEFEVLGRVIHAPVLRVSGHGEVAVSVLEAAHEGGLKGLS
jgi:phosphoribosylformylglycinamidine synthase